MSQVKIFIAVLFIVLLIQVPIAFAVSPTPAQTLFGDPGSPGEDLTVQRVLGIITGLACWFTRVALVLVVGALAFYALMFFASQGNPEKMTDAKKALGWGIVGIFVILGTYTIILTVAAAVGPAARGRINPIPISCPSF